MKFILFLVLFSHLALAGDNDKLHRPHSFAVSNGKAVFADFTEATYNITYDVTQKSAFVVAQINFDLMEAGFPIFDSVSAPSKITLDGQTVKATETKTPQNETTLRVINKLTTIGSHELIIELPLTTLVDFSDGGVKSAFWTSDLDEREYLERYLPANFEFDQVKMNFMIKFIGAKTPQMIYTNGVMTVVDSQTTKISYPAYYTSSSIFFHTVPKGATEELRFSLKSIDGRDIPAVVYYSKSIFSSFTSLERLKQKTSDVFHELESDYGAFLHPSITVLNAGSGGMEYCGATMTDYSALGHELFHSYFARGVMPANGNAGWLDEALASWRDDGYETITTLNGTSQMSAHPYYTRITDTAAYTFGERFMSYLDGKFESKGGLKLFLRHMVEKRALSPIFVEEFINEMSSFYGVSVMEDFKKYTFGSENNFSDELKHKSHPIHRKMSLKELQKFL